MSAYSSPLCLPTSPLAKEELSIFTFVAILLLLYLLKHDLPTTYTNLIERRKGKTLDINTNNHLNKIYKSDLQSTRLL